MKFIVDKSIVIDAPRETILQNIRQLSNWEKWSPWLCLDPNTINKTENDITSWDSKLIGKGQIEYVNTDGDTLYYDLTFFTPFKSKAKVKFTITEQSGKQLINWHMIGNLPFFMFFFKKFMTIVVGKDYERGLLRLKYLSETGGVPAKLEFVDTPFNVAGFNCMGIVAKGKFSEVASHMTQTFTKLHGIIEQEKLQYSKMMCFCEKVAFVKDSIQYSAAIEVDANAVSNELKKSAIPEHKAIKVTLYGDYKFLSDAWSGLHVHTRGLKLAAHKQIPPYEVYIQGPHNCDNPDDYVTEIYMPLA